MAEAVPARMHEPRNKLRQSLNVPRPERGHKQPWGRCRAGPVGPGPVGERVADRICLGAAGDEQGVTERSSQAEAETTRSPTRSESRDQTTRRGASRAEGADAERMAQQGRRCRRDRRRCDAREPEGRSEADERSVRKPRADDESCDGCESRCVQDVQGASALSGGCPSCPGRSMGQRRTQYR